MDVKFIDLFAGIGGFRLGFENAIKNLGLTPNCVFSSEIKSHATKVYSNNFKKDYIHGDITKINAEEIPAFDYLLAGFPCQAFSTAGKRRGFADTRGTLFFEVERILKHHKPKGFILENVEGMVKHDLAYKNDEIGRTLTIILKVLRSMGYLVSWEVLNSKDFGIPQSRKRIFIVGSNNYEIPLNEFPSNSKKLGDILEKDIKSDPINLSKILFKKYKSEELYGKAIKDRRGGKDNIHSWDLDLKGKTTKDQKLILSELLKARRNKKWAKLKGISWSDGMPLTCEEISSFCKVKNLKTVLDDLVMKGYLVFRHPKDFVETYENGNLKLIKQERTDIPKGYNLVTGKLSFEISNILHPEKITGTLVATDIHKLAVVDGYKLRRLSINEIKRLFGFPTDFKVEVNNSLAYELFGNSIVVPVVESVAERLLKISFNNEDIGIDAKYKNEIVQKELSF